jgi:hypothetical protein
MLTSTNPRPVASSQRPAARGQRPEALYANEVKVIPNYSANKLLLTNPLLFFIVAAINLATPKTHFKQNRIQ